jgi:hypothetical protein
LSEELGRKRGCGIVTIALAARLPDLSDQAAADRVVQAEGFSGLGDRWRGLDEEGAKRALRRLLERDLAYATTTMSQGEAAGFIDRWLLLSSAPRSFWTNGPWAHPSEPSWHWDPITASTFDGGVVAVDDVRAVLLLVQDED